MIPAQSPESMHFKAGTLLLVDKPEGWTSFDVVNKIRNAIRRVIGVKKIKVGHAGTLDPMATGLLLICTGKWTKRISELQGMEKGYTGTLCLGAETASFDRETPVVRHCPVTHITAESIHSTAEQFTGALDQIPPKYSAIKQDGVPLYKRARKGMAIEVRARKVYIRTFSITGIDMPEVTFKVHCSKGTYIRSLAHDFGAALGSCAYLTALRRDWTGPYRLAEAWDLEDLISAIERRR